MSQASQDEIDALLAEAESLATDVGGEPAAEPAAPAAPPETPAKKVSFSNASPELQRILQLEVPVIVQLAERIMTMQEILELKVGSVVEFEKRFDAELDLIVTNRSVGRGLAVKVGENFGLRITRIGTVYDTINALGN